MSAERQNSIPFALLMALLFALSACARPPTPASLPQQASPTPAPLLIPQGYGLPQVQSQGDPTPPALHLSTPEPQSTSPAQEVLENPMSRLPQAAPAQQDAIFDIVGIWASQQETPYGTVYSQVILERAGTYSMQTWWLDLLAYEVGTYYVGDGFIHFMLDNYEPKIYKGKTMSRPMSWTAWYTIVDANTMEWEDRIMGSYWTVYRQ